MVTYRFVVGYRGPSTGEKHCPPGLELSGTFPYDWTYLVAEGIVVEVGAAPSVTESLPLADMTVAELQMVAKEAGIPYSGLRKAELVAALEAS